MNIQTQIKRTAAEELLLEAFAAHGGTLPGDASVKSKREAAADLIGRGLPTRRVESWHYTDLRRLLSKVTAFTQPASTAAQPALLEGSTVLPVLASGAALPEIAGVSVAPLAGGLAEGRFADSLNVAGTDDAVGAINAAFVANGFSLDIAAGAEIAQPIELQNVHSGGHVHSRFVVKAGEGAKAIIVERQTGTGGALVSSVSELEVADGAEILWIILQEQPDDVHYLGQFKAQIGGNAKLNLLVMNVGAKLARQEVRVSMNGAHSEFHLRGVNLLAGDTHSDVTMVLDHAAPDTYSTETIRNIVSGKADGVFQGMIKVAQIAQKTDAKMACNTLLLTDEGSFSVKPELEIFADDVACGHGATITEIEKAHLFYLMARGVDEKSARGLLVKAFLAEVIEELENEQVIEVLEARLDRWFAEHA
jgi:Fe-S cluster assembly protein SufD